MSDETQAHIPSELSRNERLEQVLAKYLRQAEQGAPVDQQALLAAHPDLADDLREFFGNQIRMQRLVGVAAIPTSRNGTPSKLRYFGDYEILEEIAHGGMGVVYKARQTSLNRIVAVKMILAGQLANESDVKRFQAEAEAAANLHHPGVVGIYEVGVQDGQHYYSMEYIDGQNLAQAVREKPLPMAQAAEYVRDMALVLEYAHGRKVLHRDMKPSNVLIDASGRVRITDFGLAKRVEGESDLTMTGQVLGTPSYMSPEQAAAQHAIIGPATDIYALGAILYELVTGRPPFRSENVAETLRQVQHDEPVRPRLLNPRLPRDLETICLKCLEKEPRRRYGSAQLLADDLGRYLRGEPILARPISRPARVWRWCRRKPVVASLAAITSLALALAIAVLIVSNVLVNDALSARTQALSDLSVQQNQTKEALTAKTTALTDLDGSNRKLRDSLTKEQQVQSRLTATNATLRESIVREQGATYARGVNLVFQHLAANDLPQANAILEECGPGKLRGWEWRYLKRQCNPAGLFFTRGYVGQGSVSPFSPDGRTLAVFPDDGTIRLVELPSGNDVAILRGHNANVTALAFSPDGTRVAAAGSHWDRGQGIVHGQVSVWDAKDGRQLFAAMKAASKLAFSPDSKSLAVGVTADPKQVHIELLDIESGRPLKSFPSETGTLEDIAFTPDGKFVVAAGAGGAFHVETGEPAFPMSPPPTASNQCLAFSSDGKWLALGNLQGVITIWDMQQKVIARTIQAHAEYVHSLSFHRDSRTLASASNDRSVKVWDAPSGRELYSVRHASLGFCAAAFSPDGEYLLTATWGSGQFNHFGFAVMTRGKGVTSGEVRVWHASSGPAARLLSGHNKSVWGIQHSGDGKLIATASEDKSIILWEAATGKELLALPGHEDFVCGLAFGRQDKILASASRDKTVRLWDSATGRELQVLRHRAEAHAVAFSQDGKWVASTSSDGTVTIWNVETGDEVYSWTAHQGRATSVAFRADGRQVVTAGTDKAVRIWDTNNWQQVGDDLTQSGIVFQIALTPDGKRLGVVGTNGQLPCGFGFMNSPEGYLQLHRERRDGFVRVWDLTTNQDAFRIPDQPHAVYGIAFTPDSSRMAVTTDRGLRFWDLALGQELLTLPLGRGTTHGVSISRDGHEIAVTDGSGNVSLLNAEPRPHELWRDLAFRRQDEGRLLLSANDRPAARKALQEALHLREQIVGAEPKNLRYQVELAAAHEDWEQFQRNNGQPPRAAEARKLSTELRQRLASESPNLRTLSDDLAWTLLNQSLNAPSAPGQNSAEEIGRRGLAVLEQLQKETPDSPAGALNLTTGQIQLARLMRRTRPDAAPVLFQQAIDVLMPLIEKHPQLATLRTQLISIRAELADTHQQLGKRDDALAAQQRTVAQTEQLAQLFPWAPAYRHELARQTGRLGKYLAGVAQGAEADAAIARTQAILEQLILEAPQNSYYQRDLGRHYMEQAQRHKSLSQHDQAEAAFQKALPLFEQLAGPRASVAEQREYGVAVNELGIFYLNRGRYDETQPLYEKATTLREKLAAQNKNDAVYAVDLGGSYCNMGHLFFIGRKEPEKGLPWYEKSIQTLQPLAAKNPTASRYLFNAYQGRAESLFQLSRYAEAGREFELGMGLGIEPGATALRWRRALAWACAGEHDKAAQEAEALSAAKLPARSLVDLAEVWSRAAEAAKTDPALADSYGQKGLTAVKDALALGYKDGNHLKTSVHLETLRTRSEFHEILRQAGLEDEGL